VPVGLSPLLGVTGADRMRHVSYRILIVDDSNVFRRTAAQLLAKRGFEPTGAVADGEAALAAVSSDCPDGILLDINMQGRDGFAVAASISSVCPTVIVLTSSDIEEVPSAALKACGATAFVPKVELATADLEGLFALGRSGPGQDRR
jgi:two-component system, NarL family, nitrate/nitrite response regulator NarL